MKNIFFFGGSGFIGKHFVRHCTQENNDILVYIIDIENVCEHRSVEVINCDVRESISFDFNRDNESVIINLAAIHRTPGHTDKEYFETNIRGAENVCEFAEKNGINNIIFTSSIAPYGASDEKKTEETLPMPNSPYGISKFTAEYIHRNWQAADIQNRKLQIIRPGVVFGLGENGNFTRLYSSLKKGTFFYPGRKDTLKGCIYVKDLVDLVFQIDKSFNNGVRLYNFSYEPSPSIMEIVETICLVTGVRHPKMVVSGKMLMTLAWVLEKIGGLKMDIHPDRVKKLMMSTNISGQKIINDGFLIKFGLKKGIEDWYFDCKQKGLF